ncbi:unnamed protein product [Heligmosomoides polygyrus]|uniref:SPT6_acidic domain-containing protein n=1 Tax=Heligmosomoides polygyrus TaxID=6339 RepID=A0A183GNR6_HELPZ|nr:unnamed protein product [Heligmosomoides polygyrus]
MRKFQAGEADVESSESAKSEDESRDADADVGDSDICSNDSFVVGDEALDSGESEDALDLLDQQLEGETDRRHERYMRKAGEQQGDDDEDESDVEYITDYEDEEDEQDQVRSAVVHTSIPTSGGSERVVLLLRYLQSTALLREWC